MELNPNHAVTHAMHDQWHKIVALLMVKFNQHHIEITPEDLTRVFDNSCAVAIQIKNESIMLDLVSMDEANRLAQKEGGLAH